MATLNASFRLAGRFWDRIPKIAKYYTAGMLVIVSVATGMEKLGFESADNTKDVHELFHEIMEDYRKKEYESYNLFQKAVMPFVDRFNYKKTERLERHAKQNVVYQTYGIAVVFAPLFEELIFRLPVILFPILLVPSSLLFGYLHGKTGDHTYKIISTIFGLTMGLYVIKYQLLWPCMLVHALHNLTACTVIFHELEYFKSFK